MTTLVIWLSTLLVATPPATSGAISSAQNAVSPVAAVPLDLNARGANTQSAKPQAVNTLSATQVAPGADAVPAVDTLVICPAPLVPGLAQWRDYRERQGHRLLVWTQCDSVASIREVVRRVAAGGALRFVVLVGDVQLDPLRRDVHVATDLVVATVNQRWGSETHIATDNTFADLDGDGTPELAIGRLPADTPEEVQLMCAKSMAYEQAASHGTWRRRVNVVAGVGGFGLLTDAVLETATRNFLQSGIPDAYQTSMTYASWRSPYCPDPRDFRRQVVQRINEGCLCWVYIGHGQREGLDWIRVPAGVAPILEGDDVQRIDCADMPPIAVFLSCYGAAFDGPVDSMAERMVRNPRGPVAALGGSRVTMPYGMAILAQSLMKEMFTQQPQTVGEMLLTAKRHAVSRDANEQRPWLDAVAKVLSPNPQDLIAERREHVQLFHLIGDPLLRLHYPQGVLVKTAARVVAGDEVAIVCDSQVSGDCLIELTCRRGQLTFRPDPRASFDASDRGMLALNEVYRQANDDRYVSHRVANVPRQFRAHLRVPKSARGNCAVRVFVQGVETFAMGAALLNIAAPPQDAAAEGVLSVSGDSGDSSISPGDADEPQVLALPSDQETQN